MSVFFRDGMFELFLRYDLYLGGRNELLLDSMACRLKEPNAGTAPNDPTAEEQLSLHHQLA